MFHELLERIEPQKCDDESFAENAIAVYKIKVGPPYGHVYISEMTDGRFWTIVERNDYLGTLSGAIQFLKDNL